MSADLLELGIQLSKCSEDQLVDFIFQYLSKIKNDYEDNPKTRRAALLQVTRNLISQPISYCDPFYFFQNALKNCIPDDSSKKKNHDFDDLPKDVMGNVVSFLSTDEVKQSCSLVSRWWSVSTKNHGFHPGGFDAIQYLYNQKANTLSTSHVHPSSIIDLNAGNWAPHVHFLWCNSQRLKEICHQMSFGSLKKVTTSMHGFDPFWEKIRARKNVTQLELFAEPRLIPPYHHSKESIERFSTVFPSLQKLTISYFEHSRSLTHFPATNCFPNLKTLQVLCSAIRFCELITYSTPIESILIGGLSRIHWDYAPESFPSIKELVFCDFNSTNENKIEMSHMLLSAPNLEKIGIYIPYAALWNETHNIFRDDFFTNLALKPKLKAIIFRTDIIPHVAKIAPWIWCLDTKSKVFQLTIVSKYLWQSPKDLRLIIGALRGRFKYFELRIPGTFLTTPTWSNIFKYEEKDIFMLDSAMETYVVYASSNKHNRSDFDFDCDHCLSKNMNF